MTFKPLQELRDTKLPNVRDYDAHVYVRQLGDRYMMGAFETLARPWDVTKHGIDPDWNTRETELTKGILDRITEFAEIRHGHVLGSRVPRVSTGASLS